MRSHAEITHRGKKKENRQKVNQGYLIKKVKPRNREKNSLFSQKLLFTYKQRDEKKNV